MADSGENTDGNPLRDGGPPRNPPHHDPPRDESEVRGKEPQLSAEQMEALALQVTQNVLRHLMGSRTPTMGGPSSSTSGGALVAGLLVSLCRWRM